MNFPNLELLSLRSVFAFPNASKRGLARKTLSTVPAPCFLLVDLLKSDSEGLVPSTVAKWFMTIFIVSVFPAPLSPVTRIVWSLLSMARPRYDNDDVS